MTAAISLSFAVKDYSLEAFRGSQRGFKAAAVELIYEKR